MKREGKPLADLRQVMTRYPQVIKNVPVRAKPPLESLEAVTAAIHAVEGKLGQEGRVLVRYSGTEMTVRVMVEGTSLFDIQAHAEALGEVLEVACR
jgi:phosphoglucosamine mutase